MRCAHLAAVLGGEGKGALPEAGGDASAAAFALRISCRQRNTLPPVRRAAVDALNRPITLGEVLKVTNIARRGRRRASTVLVTNKGHEGPLVVVEGLADA